MRGTREFHKSGRFWEGGAWGPYVAMCPYSEPKSVSFESFLHAPRGNHRLLHPRGNETRGIDLCSMPCSDFVAIPRESKAKSGSGSTISIWTVPAIFTSPPRKWTPIHPRGASPRSTGWSGATGKSRFWRARRDWRKVTCGRIRRRTKKATFGIARSRRSRSCRAMKRPGFPRKNSGLWRSTGRVPRK